MVHDPHQTAELRPPARYYIAPPADTRRVVSISPRALQRATRRDVCACTFYLVFKEPTCPRSPSAFLSSGEPFNPTSDPYTCQRFCNGPPPFFAPALPSRFAPRTALRFGDWAMFQCEPSRDDAPARDDTTSTTSTRSVARWKRLGVASLKESRRKGPASADWPGHARFKRL